MAQAYENFDLYLIGQATGISVECHCPARGGFPALETRSISMPLSVSIPTTNTLFGDLQIVGEEIAKVLLPEGEIRQLFRNWWNTGLKIRLRLIYPHPDFDNQSEADQVKQIKEISSHPWEYLYLTRDDTDQTPCSKYLLGIREDISIVHWLRKSGTASQRRISVESLPVSIRYISNLGGDSQNEKEILDEFVRETGELQEIVEYKAVGEPGDFDAVIGFMEDHLVHITSHGNLDALKIEPDDPFTKFEMLKAFNQALNPQVKGVVLLSCSSNVGDGGLAAWLHRRANVPVVVGMTGSILPDPSAINFVKGFYHGLGRSNEGLEIAAFFGRLSMFNQGILRIDEKLEDSQWDPSFGLPRLFLNGPNSILIPENLLFGSDDMVRGFDNFIRRESRNKNRHPKTNEWQAALAAWAEDPQAHRWFLMTGPAGSGKSIQIAWLLDRLKKQNEKIVYHFCQPEAEETITPLDFIRDSIVPQLVKLYAAYKENITPGRFPLRVGNEDDALWSFVIDPLSRLIEEGNIDRLPVIVIDSIDATPRSNPENSILGLLLRHRGDLDKVARFLVTANSDPDTETGLAIIEDIRRLTYHYQEGEADLTIEKLDDSLILFSKLKRRLVPLISEGPSYPGKIKKWNDLYKLLDAAIEAARQKYGELAIQLLTVVTVAYEPLSDNHIAKLLGFRSNPDEIEQFKKLLRGLQPFFKNYRDYRHKLILYHNSLKTYLFHKMKREHEHSLADTHELFVVAIRPESGDWAKITNWNTLAGANWQERPDGRTAKPEAGIARYVRRYLGDHTYYTYYYTSWESSDKRRERTKDFLNLICDPGFRTMRPAEVGRDAAVQDLWNGLRVVYTEYLHTSPTPDNNEKTRLGLDRLLAANEPGSEERNELIQLERKLCDGQAGVPDLLNFLVPPLWET